MNITLTITASEPILAIFQAFVAGVQSTPQTPAPKKVQVKETPAAKELPAAPEAPAGEEKVTLEQLRAVSQAKSQAGKRDGVKGLLAKYGVDRITALATDQYGAFYAEMDAL